jgi:oligoendopeptidase F
MKGWSLGDLYPSIDSPELEAAKKELREEATNLETYRSDLSDEIEPESLLTILEAYEHASRLLSGIFTYGQLKYMEDTQNPMAQANMAQAHQLVADFDNQTMFFKLWWKGLEDSTAETLMAAVGDYRYWLEAVRLHKPYTLSEAEERIINLKDVNGVVALVTLYQTITNSYTYRLSVDGEEKELTRGGLATYYRDPDAELREQAYKELLETYAKDAPILGMIYQHLARDWRSEGIDLRGYASPIAMRNLANDIPDEVVDSMLEACQTNAPLFHRYFRLKARWLDKERIRRYDIYAPVVDVQKEIPFAEGVPLVLESFRAFDDGMATLAEKIFSENHIDSEIRKGKSSGAFCATATPDLTPWVLQSYQSQPNDLATMAHELGHAVHALLASHHTALTQGAALPLQETASIFGEMLLIDHLLEVDPDPELQKALLFRQMDDAYVSIMRQAYLATFERSAHDLVGEGGSVDDLSEAYLGSMLAQFGDSIEVSDDFRSEWLAIPHIFRSPFYVYAYSFGQLLVLSLYQQYKREGEAFKPRYLEILSAGGSDAPVRILELGGFYIRSP